MADKPWLHEHYEGSDSGSFDDCGPVMEFEGTFRGHILIREVPESGGQAFLGHDVFKFRFVTTNTETGKWLVERGHFNVREVTATHLGGDIWEFTARESGQFVVEDMSGKVVLRDRGMVESRYVFDTLGDGQPGGEFLEFEVTDVHGPHPSFDVDFCELALDLTG